MRQRFYTKTKGDTVKLPLLVPIPTGAIARVHLRESPESESMYDLSIVDSEIIISAEITAACSGEWSLDVQYTLTDETVSTVQRATIYFDEEITRAYNSDFSLLSDFERRIIIAEDFKFRKTDGTLESIPSIESLDALVTQSEQILNDAGNLEIAIAAAESARVTAEGLRVTAEQARASVEGLRVTAESARVTAESLRVTADQNRSTAEGLRVTAESARVTAEGLRVTAESARVTAEGLRVTAEQARVTAEGLRVTAESSRVSVEQGRVTAEGLRVTAESARVTAEGLRVTAESARVTVEGLRVTAEQGRVTAEQGRVTAEAARVAAGAMLQTQNKQTTGTSTTDVMSQDVLTKFLARFVKDYNNAYNLKGIAIANQTAPVSPSANDVHFYTGSTTATVFGIASVTAGSFMLYNGTVWSAVTLTAASQTPEAPNDGLPYIRKSAAWTGLYSIMEDMLSYGISWDSTVTTAAKTRIGNMSFHATLPIQARIKGCILKDDGTVYKYLPTTGAWDDADLTGTNGQVMIEIPSHYRIFTTNGNAKTARISFDPLPGYHLVLKTYISAYEASIQRSTGKLCSVKNTAVDFRGGNNQSAWDGTNKSVLCRPVTNITRTALRTAARLRATGTAWNMLDYNSYNALYWLYLIEYANTNSQLAFNAAKDSNGYAQGGLGNGVTDWVSADWNTFNGYYPFVPCGHSDSLGNASGEVSYAIKDVDNVTVLKTVYVNRYRGVENPFGHIYKFLDGCNLEILTDAGGGTSKLYVATNPANFNDADYSGHTYRGLLARTSGYILKMLIGEFGELLPTDVGAGSTTGWCDYFYTDPAANNGLRVVLAGGNADTGADAGFGCSRTAYAPSSASARFGSRLCFLPA